MVLTLVRCTFELEQPDYHPEDFANHHTSYVQVSLYYECDEPYWEEDAEWCDYFGDSPCCTWYTGDGCYEEWCDWANNDCWEFEFHWCDY